MLVFHTILPLKPTVTRKQCVELFIEWVAGNHHLPFTAGDFETYDKSGHEELTITKGIYTYAISHYKDEHTELTACKLIEIKREIWETNNVYVNTDGKIKLYIQTHYTGSSFGDALPSPHPPFTIKLFIRNNLCASDEMFDITDRPIVMDDHLVEPCGKSMQGQWGNLLPIVYCSKDYWPINLDVSYLANKLQGIAHVISEPSLEISYKLRAASVSNNAFRGHVGIYLPGQSYYRKFNTDGTETPGVRLEDEIINTVKNAWLNTEDAALYSWDQVQTLKSRQRVGLLEKRTSEFGETKELNGLYESDNERLAGQNKELQKEKRVLYDENERLKTMLDAYRSAGGQAQSYLIRTGEEFDLYPGEQNDLLLEIMQKALPSLAVGTRPHSIITSILSANSKIGHREQIEESIRKIFANYGGISSDKQKRELKTAGFEVEKPGGHYKITFAGDDRYMFTVAATPGDHCAGQNMISDIIKKLFLK